jgi:hypothetical protein
MNVHQLVNRWDQTHSAGLRRVFASPYHQRAHGTSVAAVWTVIDG